MATFSLQKTFFKVIEHFLSKILKGNLSPNNISYFLLYVVHFQFKKSSEILKADI
jgi:hypothetical protein